MKEPREIWTSSRGFVLATIGAAVGLGNIWRFSYIAGENGGGAFLIVYLVSVLLVGAPIVIAELALGRRSIGDTVAAYARTSVASRWRLAGWFTIGGSFLILSYYAVIAGWALKYFVGAVTGQLWHAAAGGYGAYFESFIGDPGESVSWQAVILAIAMVVVAAGVRRGIEAVNRVLLPLLAVLVVMLAAYAATLPGAAAGWRFLFLPDWSVLLRGEILVAALGQAFFSIGLGMAIYITYGSYMHKSTNVPRAAAAIVVGDTLFAIVAGLAIFPAVFAFGMDPQAGPQLAFITLPQVFLAMPGGIIVGVIFFGLLVSAALTSMIALLEVPVATVVFRTRLRRRGAVIAIGACVFAFGLPSALSYGILVDYQPGGRAILDFVDQTIANYFLPLAGIATCVYVGWHWQREEALDASGLENAVLRAAWLWLLRIIAPVMILLVLMDSVHA
jgi:neurotransmitter:Na+ symporter, NSS family